MKKTAFGAGLFIVGCLMLCLSKTAISSDLPDSAMYSYSINIQPTSSQQYAKSTFLPDRFDDLGLSDYDTIHDNHNFNNCDSYPLTSCPTGGRCEKCPFNSKLLRLYSCSSPYILSDGTCTCPEKVTIECTNDKCTKYCGSTCIKKSCIPSANQTGCTNGTQYCDNGCCAKTRKCCIPCTHKVTKKPANSSYTYSSCTDGNGTKQIQAGWKCDPGYHEKNGECEKDCIANACSGYPLKSCPENANCDNCKKETTLCGGGDTMYKMTGCVSGYHASGNSCVPHSYTCPSGYQSSLCSSSEVQTATASKKCSCGATSGTCYACRAKTCEEQDLKTCNGSCIAKTECCGGCPSGFECKDGLCASKEVCDYNKECSGYTFTSCSLGTPVACTACGITKYRCQLDVIDPPNLSCGNGLVRLKCGNDNCCCPEGRGCDTNSQIKWCTCEYTGGAIDTGISTGGGTTIGGGGGGSGSGVIDGCAAYRDNCSDYCRCMKNSGRLSGGPEHISTSIDGNLAVAGSSCRCSADGNPL